jgi:hypothetical protein
MGQGSRDENEEQKMKRSEGQKMRRREVDQMLV